MLWYARIMGCSLCSGLFEPCFSGKRCSQMFCPFFQGSASECFSEQACRSLPVPGSGITKTVNCGRLCVDGLDGGTKDMGLLGKHLQRLWWYLPTATCRCTQIPSYWWGISGHTSCWAMISCKKYIGSDIHNFKFDILYLSGVDVGQH